MAPKDTLKFKCILCGESFDAKTEAVKNIKDDKQSNPWCCPSGELHKVDLKTYYVKSEGLTVYYGGVVREPGNVGGNHRTGVITFTRGAFQSTDPQQQEFLSTYPACVTYEEWRESHIPDKERQRMDKDKSERLERENNDLLAKVRKLEEDAAKKAS